jgi:hypothetical protein
MSEASGSAPTIICGIIICCGIIIIGEDWFVFCFFFVGVDAAMLCSDLLEYRDYLLSASPAEKTNSGYKLDIVF